MKKMMFAVLLSVLPMAPVAVQQAVAAPVQVKELDNLYDAEGKLVGQVFRVTASGSAVVDIGSKLVTVPVGTLSKVGGKLTTSLTAQQIAARR